MPVEERRPAPRRRRRRRGRSLPRVVGGRGGRARRARSRAAARRRSTGVCRRARPRAVRGSADADGQPRGQRPVVRRQGGGAPRGCGARPSASASARAAASAAPSAAMPPSPRRPRNSASSSMRAALPAVARVHAEGGEGMLEEREQPHRVGRLGQPPRRAAGRRRPRGMTVERRAGGIVDGEAPAAELGRDAAGERAVGRHQRRPSRRASRPPRGWRARWRAPPPARCGRRGRRRRQARVERPRLDEAGADRGPRVGGLGRAQRLGDEPGAVGERRTAPRRAASTSSRRDAEAGEELLQAELRMAEAAAAAGLADGLPAASSRSWSRPGRTTRALRQAGDRLEQLGGRRDRAGRAGGDHRPAGGLAGGAPASARISVSRRTAGSTRPRLGEMRRPVLGDDLQEVEGDLEVAGVVLRHEAADRRPTATPAVSMSSISRARSPASRAASAAEAGISSGSSGARSSRSRRTARPQASVSSVSASWRGRRPIAAGSASRSAAGLDARRRGGAPPRRRRRSAG